MAIGDSTSPSFPVKEKLLILLRHLIRFSLRLFFPQQSCTKGLVALEARGQASRLKSAPYVLTFGFPARAAPVLESEGRILGLEERGISFPLQLLKCGSQVVCSASV